MKQAIIALFLALFLSGCINNAPVYEEAVKAAWAQVENQYKRRADLIPNLVETVKGYAKHEEDIFIQVTKARAKAGQIKLDSAMLEDPAMLAKFQEAQSQLSSALTKLLAVSERYPDLKANQNFLALQQQLEGTENRISVARRDYIKAVERYNLEFRKIPNKWIAALFHSELKPKEVFSVQESDLQNPQVSF
jgi:LemA protein